MLRDRILSLGNERSVNPDVNLYHSTNPHAAGTVTCAAARSAVDPSGTARWDARATSFAFGCACYKAPVRRFSHIAVWCVITAGSAYADNTEVHATAAGSVATTDNVNGSATDPQGSIFTDVRPGLLMNYNSPRAIMELIPEVDLFYYFGRQKPNVTFRAEWKGFFLPGPRSELSLDALASRGQLNSLTASTPSNENPLQVQPAGVTNTANLTASENGSYTATEFTRLFERSFARRTTTEDTNPDIAVKTKSFEVGGGVGFDHRLRYDSFTFEAGASYVFLRKDDPLMKQMGSRLDKQVNPRVVGIWSHDFSREWSTSLNAGLVYVNPIFSEAVNGASVRRAEPFPVFGAIAAYTDVWGRAQLDARREVTPNLFIAQNTINDAVNVTFAMPLTFLDKDQRRRNPRVVGIGSAGVARTQLIDPTSSDLNGQFWLERVDASVAWEPRTGQTFGMRAELTNQNGDTVGEMTVPSFHRFTFYFTFALRWPEDVGVRVPRRANSVRADQKDLAPIGAEPVVIDPAELLEEGQGGGDR